MSSKQFKDLKTEVTSLSKQFQDVSERISKLEEDCPNSDLKSSLSLALKRISHLEESLKGSGQAKSTSESVRKKSLSLPEMNRDYLKTLSPNQVSVNYKLVLIRYT